MDAFGCRARNRRPILVARRKIWWFEAEKGTPLADPQAQFTGAVF
jgi:hypothetical protein